MSNSPATDMPRWTSAQTRAQLVAVARLRWWITINSLRRKGGTGEFVGRIVTYLAFACLSLGPALLAGFMALWFVSSGRLDRIAWLLWATFGLCQLLNVQVGQPGTTFDPTQLIRFPLNVADYTVIRLCFGLLTPANLIGTLMSFAIALGVLFAAPALWWFALLALAVFASANVLFSRMIFAWVDRWLATRRAREIFTALIFVFSLGAEWLNVSYNPAYNRHRHIPTHAVQNLTGIGHMYQSALPWLRLLPPELTTSSLIAAHRGQMGMFFGLTFICGLFSLVFWLVFALRMRIEFRGESLSDSANAVARTRSAGGHARTGGDVKHAAAASASTAAGAGQLALAVAPRRGLLRLSPVLSAMLSKEILYVRRNTGLFYSLIAPIVFVFLFAGRLATRNNSVWIFPTALAYTMLGVTPLSYNSFGLEATGAQFYFLAPVPMREVFLAKNLMNFLLALLEAAAVFGIITYVAVRPAFETTALTLLWAAATLLLSTTLGNRRSISAPKQIKTVRASRKQASPLSAFIGMGVLAGSAAIAAMLLGFALYFHAQWTLLPIFAIWFVAALIVYRRDLRQLDRYAMDHREELFNELCKKA